MADSGRDCVRLLAPERPFADEFLDFRVKLQDLGLNATTAVRTIRGDGLASWARTLADSYAGWDGDQSWESLERDARITRGMTDAGTSRFGSWSARIRRGSVGGLRHCRP